MFASLQENVNLYAELTRYGYLERQEKAKKKTAKSRDILNAVCAFDIETTTINLPITGDQQQNAHGFMYIWQFQINDKTFTGRTWDDFIMFIGQILDCLKRAKKEWHTATVPTLICWVHNLSFEFQYLTQLYDFTDDECFFRDVRKPIYCRMFNCIEFRCSYIQTNMNLKQLTETMGVEVKLSGQRYDYSKVRYPWTPLTDYEMQYCITDVRSLVECMRKKLANDGDTLQTIPLTSTGYVRRDCILSLEPYRLQLKDILPDEKYIVPHYKLLRQAFRGGNTHANRRMVEHILTDVRSYDMSSCYPAQQLTKKFPMHKWRFIDNRLSLGRVLDFIGLQYAVVAVYQFSGFRLKNPDEPIPYVSFSRVKAYGIKLDNGRILSAEYIEMALTEIDLQIVLRQYYYDTIDIKTAMVSRKDYLPEPYRDVIRNYYRIKTELKPPKGEDAPYIYGKSKEKLNGIYGMTCQNVVRQDILFNHGKYVLSSYDDAGARKAIEKAHFPYCWGCYTTSYARASLQEAIDLAGDRIAYCDTDSIKVLGEVDLSAINAHRIALAEKNRAYADDRYGVRHYVGVFELDGHYDRFVTCGAKRYAYEAHGKLCVTVSGVSKAVNEETGETFASEELGCLENFHAGYTIGKGRNKEEVPGMEWRLASGNVAIYNDHDDFDYIDPDTGQSVHIGRNVAIIPTTYKMTHSRDYYQLLKEIGLYSEYKEKRE